MLPKPGPLRWLCIGVSFWVALSLFILGPEFFFGGWANDYRLATIGQSTVGRVTAVQPDNHESCSYRFEVGGREFRDSQQLCPADARVGGTITVTYLSSNPTISIVSSPWNALQTAIIFGIGVPALMGGFVAWNARARWSRQQRALGLDWQT
jgi:hypothetical protein